MTRSGRTALGCLAGVLGVATVAMAAESDHLLGYKIKDLDKLKVTAAHVLLDQFGTQNCQLTKAQFLFVPATKDNGDDPRGGPAGTYVCFKAKCSGSVPPTTALNTQFGNVNLESKKAQLICAPVDIPVCGNNQIEGSEQCDGTAMGSCTSGCLANCTCAAGPTCGNNIKEGTEQCDGSDDSACPGICHADCTCGTVCGTVVEQSGANCPGGECPAGQMCQGSGNLLSPSCGCIPSGSMPCFQAGAPACGGVCPVGQTCIETVTGVAICGCM